MPPPILVIGHKNPDTDAICSALSYAELLRRQTGHNVVAGRLGALRPETTYLLERFHIKPPELVADIRYRVGDAMTSPAVTALERDSLYEVGRRQQGMGMRPMPVVNDEGLLTGIVEPNDFAKVFFQGLDPGVGDLIPIEKDNLVRALDATILVEGPKISARRKVMVAAYSLESIMLRLEPAVVLVVGDRTDVQLAAIEFGVAMLIVTGGSQVLPDVIELARAKDVTVIAVEHHTATTLRLIHMSIPVSFIMRRDPPSCEPEDLVDDIRGRLTSERALSVVDELGRVTGVITRADVLRGARRRVVLVDHNERSQSVDGVEQADIIAVIDHHRVADFQTVQPPFMRIEPLGACCSVIAKLYREAGIAIPGPLAGIMLGAILADTLLFKSPTTTTEDLDIARELSRLASVDSGELGLQILAIVSDVSDRKAQDLVRGDFKSFTLGTRRFGVGVIETGNGVAVLDRRAALLDAMNELRGNEYACILLVVTDIVHDATTILIDGYADHVARTFGASLEDQCLIKLPGVYSRKKQIVPMLGRLRDFISADEDATRS